MLCMCIANSQFRESPFVEALAQELSRCEGVHYLTRTCMPSQESANHFAEALTETLTVSESVTLRGTTPRRPGARVHG